jgi:hypothetical protein
VLFYRAALPLSAQTLSYVAGVIRGHRLQDRLVLAQAESRPAGVGTATAWRYARETITLLGAQVRRMARCGASQYGGR